MISCHFTSTFENLLQNFVILIYLKKLIPISGLYILFPSEFPRVPSILIFFELKYKNTTKEPLLQGTSFFHSLTMAIAQYTRIHMYICISLYLSAAICMYFIFLFAHQRFVQLSCGSSPNRNINYKIWWLVKI